jgi:hypothetical protein
VKDAEPRQHKTRQDKTREEEGILGAARPGPVRGDKQPATDGRTRKGREKKVEEQRVGIVSRARYSRGADCRRLTLGGKTEALR